MIQIDHLQKVFDATIAVKDISLSIPAGVVCGLVGPNGAGKTTTLRCLAGLIPATLGSIRVAGHCPVQDPIGLRGDCVYVPDDPPLFDDLSVGGHLDFIAQMYRIADHRQKAYQLLEQFELIAKYDASVNSLSRGMRQKLAVACAYLANPQVLLLDEPLTGLDPPGIRVLLASIREFAAAGRSVIVSSHLLAMIGEVCDQVLVMQDGQIRFHGSKTQLLEAYPDTHSLEDAFFAATSGNTTTCPTVAFPSPPALANFG